MLTGFYFVFPIITEMKVKVIKHKGTVTLTTERLNLRRFVLSDSKKAYENWYSDPKVAMYMRWDAHNSINETEEMY